MGKSPELKPETLMLLGAITGKHSRYRQRHDSEKDSNNTQEIIRADKWNCMELKSCKTKEPRVKLKKFKL